MDLSLRGHLASAAATNTLRKEYNQERPHEVLGMEAPASWYRPSNRAYPARTPEMSYPDHMRVRRMRSDGVGAADAGVGGAAVTGLPK